MKIYKYNYAISYVISNLNKFSFPTIFFSFANFIILLFTNVKLSLFTFNIL